MIVEKGEVTSEDDAWNMVFNVWLLLLPDKFQIIPLAEKSLYYPANFVILEALKSDNSFQSLEKRSNGNEELTFLSALIIANGIGGMGVKCIRQI